MLSAKTRNVICRTVDMLTLTVSVALIIVVSLDAFSPRTDFLHNGIYRRSQLWVCLVFMADFAAGLWNAPDRRRYVARNWALLLLSIPFAIVAEAAGIHPGPIAAYVLHLMPMARGLLALVLVLVFISGNRSIGLFVSYTAILLLIVYFTSLVFYLHESGVSPQVRDYWDALEFMSLQATTLGSDYYAQTTMGKLSVMIASCSGMLMLPVFTAALSHMVSRYVSKNQA